MRVLKAAAALFFVFAATSRAVRADDFGPRRDVAQVRSDARRLLAHRVRDIGADPKNVTISDVVVVKDQALLSWDSGKQHGVMGLVRYLDRWWDALDMQPQAIEQPSCWEITTTYPLQPSFSFAEPSQAMLLNVGMQSVAQAAATYNADAKPKPRTAHVTCEMKGFATGPALPQGIGDELHPTRQSTAGYELDIHVFPLSYVRPVTFSRVYGRAPTQAEMLPNPAPPRGWGGPTDVFYFDLELNGTKPVTFMPGTKIDIWFPFVLDDSLSYRLSYVMDGQFSKSIHGTIFDNALHFELPGFTIAPPNALQAEVEASGD